MKFLDYEKIIRDNYPLLIEGYVEDYGEEYREHIVDVLNRVKFCFYATPVTISEYLHRKRNEDFFKAVIDFYANYGIDISKIAIDEDELVFYDDKIKKFTYSLFPWLKDGKYKDEVQGLFCFEDEYDCLEFDDSITKKRIILLESISNKNHNLSYYDYYNSDDYKNDCCVMKELLSSFKKYFEKYCNDDYSELVEYGKRLEEQFYEIGMKHEKEFILDICDYLCDEDLNVVESGEEFDVKSLIDYSVLFDTTLSNEDICFSEGPVDFFSVVYDNVLLDEKADPALKKEIVMMRLRFIKHHGFDIDKLNIEDLYCDWWSIDEFKDYIPDKKLVEEVLNIKKIYVDLYNFETSKLAIINNHDLADDDPEIETIVDSNGHSSSLYVRDDFDSSNPICVVCLCPFNDTYNLFDVAVDHELRHAIETKIKEFPDGYLLKVGTDISKLNKNFDDSLEEFVLYNETVVEKLSVERCRKRWMEGKFIFSDKFALMTIYPLATYDYCFRNFDILYNEFKDEMVDAQISDDYDKIFSLFPRDVLTRINSILDISTDEVKREMVNIRNNALKTKVKKIGSR